VTAVRGKWTVGTDFKPSFGNVYKGNFFAQQRLWMGSHPHQWEARVSLPLFTDSLCGLPTLERMRLTCRSSATTTWPIAGYTFRIIRAPETPTGRTVPPSSRTTPFSRYISSLLASAYWHLCRFLSSQSFPSLFVIALVLYRSSEKACSYDLANNCDQRMFWFYTVTLTGKDPTSGMHPSVAA
jgi:hypothetical protein